MNLINSLPLRWLSYHIGKLTEVRCAWFKNFLINSFIRFYDIDLSECKYQDLNQYQNFNEFFARELAPGKRNHSPQENHIVSPVDGFISEIGAITQGKLIQAKKYDYDLLSLVGGNQALTAPFQQGKFATFYLAPQNYHRIHMPMDACLQSMIYIPGQLISVNPWAVKHISQLFCRNERVVCLFSTKLGPMVMVLVGASLVGSISTRWHGIVNAAHPLQTKQWDYTQNNIHLTQHEEMGQFRFGSTVILLFPDQTIEWLPELKAGQVIQVGEVIANLS